MRVEDAIYMSMSIPFMFVPMKYNEAFVADGALTENMPDCFPRDRTLYISCMCSGAPEKVFSFTDYITAVFQNAIDESTWFERYEHIALKLPKMMESDSSLEVSTEILMRRYRCAYASTLSYLYSNFTSTMAAVIEMMYGVVLEETWSKFAL